MDESDTQFPLRGEDLLLALIIACVIALFF
jgi:hypothetical protein